MKKLSILAAGSLMLLTAACSKQAETKKSSLNYLPADSCVIVKADAASFLKDENIKKAIASNPKAQKSLKETGIKLEDIAQFTMAMKPNPANAKEPVGCMIMTMKTSVDMEKIAKATKAEVTRDKYNGVTIYKSEDKAAAKLSEKSMVYGDLKSVKAAIDLKDGKGKDITTNNKLMSLFDKVKGKGMLTFAADTTALPKDKNAPKMNNATGWINTTSKLLSGEIKAETISATEATQAATQMNMMVNMFGGMLTQGVISGKQIAIKAEGKTLAVSIKVNEAEMKKLSEIASKPNPMLNKMIK